MLSYSHTQFQVTTRHSFQTLERTVFLSTNRNARICNTALQRSQSHILQWAFAEEVETRGKKNIYCSQATQYIGEICRYLLSVPPGPNDQAHKVKVIFGNGLRPQIWQEFVQRFGISRVLEFYGATEGNSNLGKHPSYLIILTLQ